MGLSKKVLRCSLGLKHCLLATQACVCVRVCVCNLITEIGTWPLCRAYGTHIPRVPYGQQPSPQVYGKLTLVNNPVHTIA